jgi:hypothetical protein
MLDLGEYWGRFDEALKGRYDGHTFKLGFERIENQYRGVRSDPYRPTVDDVMALFANDLPFVQDWTMPDRDDLERRMTANRVAESIHRINDHKDDVEELIEKIRYGFRELSLTALVLQHVYPDRYAMCSHHLASLLYITNAGTVPKFYIQYCKELRLWRSEKSNGKRLSVRQTQYALWTWYRLTHFGKREERTKNRDNFFEDPWVQKRRSIKIADSLGNRGRLDLARSYLETAPTVAAIIAWREFEVKIREVHARNNRPVTLKDTVWYLIDHLPQRALCGNAQELNQLWVRRNAVMHDGESLTAKHPFEKMTASERASEISKARSILNAICRFINHNTDEITTD